MSGFYVGCPDCGRQYTVAASALWFEPNLKVLCFGCGRRITSANAVTHGMASLIRRAGRLFHAKQPRRIT